MLLPPGLWSSQLSGWACQETHRSGTPDPPAAATSRPGLGTLQIHYLFLYSDDEVAGAANPSWRGPTAAGAQQQQPRAYGTAGGAGGAAVQPQQGTSPLLWLLLGFTLMLMAVGVRDNWPQVRRFLRRTLGVPLY